MSEEKKEETKPEVKPEAKAETKPEATPEAKPEVKVEPKPDSGTPKEAVSQPQQPKEEKKAPEAAKKEKPANCAACNKSIKKKRWYYRNGKYFCTKRCWHSTLKKEEKPQETEAKK